MGVRKILKALQRTLYLNAVGIANNNISKEAADDIATVLSHNTQLQKLYLGENNLKSSGVIKIARGLQNSYDLTILS